MEHTDRTVIPGEGLVAALGTFDGVHKGHLAILSAAKEESRRAGIASAAVVIDRPVLKLMSAEKRLEEIRFSGADFVFVLPIGRIKDMSPGQFVDLLREKYRVKTCVCGYNFKFGKNAEGSAGTLSSLIDTRIVEKVEIDGTEVSSSLIRKLIKDGDVEKASKYLGRSYSVSGTVEEGKRIGRRLGFPTVNIPIDGGFVIPKTGVYISECIYDKKRYPAVTDIGTSPTVGGIEKKIETHIIDFDEDLYGDKIEISFLKRIRDDAVFASGEALASQIKKDVEISREYFRKNKKDI